MDVSERSGRLLSLIIAADNQGVPIDIIKSTFKWATFDRDIESVSLCIWKDYDNTLIQYAFTKDRKRTEYYVDDLSAKRLNLSGRIPHNVKIGCRWGLLQYMYRLDPTFESYHNIRVNIIKPGSIVRKRPMHYARIEVLPFHEKGEPEESDDEDSTLRKPLPRTAKRKATKIIVKFNKRVKTATPSPTPSPTPSLSPLSSPCSSSTGSFFDTDDEQDVVQNSKVSTTPAQLRAHQAVPSDLIPYVSKRDFFLFRLLPTFSTTGVTSIQVTDARARDFACFLKPFVEDGRLFLITSIIQSSKPDLKLLLEEVCRWHQDKCTDPLKTRQFAGFYKAVLFATQRLTNGGMLGGKWDRYLDLVYNLYNGGSEREFVAELCRKYHS